jgi:hypothetical protein
MEGLLNSHRNGVRLIVETDQPEKAKLLLEKEYIIETSGANKIIVHLPDRNATIPLARLLVEAGIGILMLHPDNHELETSFLELLKAH